MNNNSYPKYPNAGAMFLRQKRSEKSPDMGGDIILSGDLLDYIIRCAERGDECKVELSGWKRKTRDVWAWSAACSTSQALKAEK